jgi:hypothetical protein
MSQEIALTLNMAELLVLSDCIHRVSERLGEIGSLDSAEQAAFWNIESMLEKLNPAIFSDHYEIYLTQAKTFLIGSEDNV